MIIFRGLIVTPTASAGYQTVLTVSVATGECTSPLTTNNTSIVAAYFGDVIAQSGETTLAGKLAAIQADDGYDAVKVYKIDNTEVTVVKTVAGDNSSITFKIASITDKLCYLDVPVVTPESVITLPPGGGSVLAPTGVVPGHYHNASVTVGVDGRLTFAESNTVSGIPDGCVDAPGNPQSGIPDGTPVALYNGQLVAANAATPSYMPCVGFYQGSSEHVLRVSGKESGFTGLVANTTYYVASGGGITSTPPTGNVVQRVGKALDTTTLFVQLGEPVA
jgi:hypothetical protein